MIFRLGTVYGKGDDHSRIRFDLVVNVLTLKSVINQEIYINGGDQWRPIISVNDVAGYIAEGCNNYCSDIFILSRENVLLKDLGIKVAKCVPNTKLVFNEIPFQDFRNYKVDNSKLLNFFKYKPQYSVEHEVGILMKIINEKRVMNPNDPIYHNGSFLNLNKEILLK
jgi:nucleoside-diphosphate-sugar epimerase